ncbi:MAG: hydantoinase/oxoprolinase family protein [Chloroflexi bacterium]|nr:hydantoinase/oxoprolinase family protein [Chloroflexota bacterium]
MNLRLGVDTGGTFTDVCLFDVDSNAVQVTKVSSTPDDPGTAVVRGVREILEQAGGQPADAIGYFAHGTTVATNALLMGRGVKTGLLTTRGFRDLLELGRGRRPKLYDLQQDKPEPVVPRDLRLEVGERVRYDGSIATPLDETEVRAEVRRLRQEGVKAIAVCLLFSYLHSDHERAIARIIAEEIPDAYVSISSDVLPEFREFERLSTVVTNAYIGPTVAEYLARLRSNLAELGLQVVPHVTQSNGGIMPFPTAEALPVRTVLSGPSTGVVGAAYLGSAAGFSNIITFDMGGTSTDVSLVQDGRPKTASGMELDGRPIRSPMIDIHTVGAGGGSLAWIDSGGHLKVGPASAGADPGPVCYGKGNTQPTVTDANVVLGVLHPEFFLGGKLPIDAAASRRAMAELSRGVDLDMLETAQGIVRVVVANMARAIRVISVQRGYDPRDYVLVPFGGAGPLHASQLASELGVRTILVPETPGALSALGLLMTDLRTDFSRTHLVAAVPDNTCRFEALFTMLTHAADEWFQAEGISAGRRELHRIVEMRYAGQNYELPVALPDGPIDAAMLAELLRRFGVEHERMYGYSEPGEPVQGVTFRVEALGRVDRPPLNARPLEGADPRSAQIDTRGVYLANGRDFAESPVYARERLRPGNQLLGPCIIEQMDTTTLLLPGDTAHVDAYGNLVITVGS